MTGRQRTRAASPTVFAARLALAGMAVSLGALGFASQANADPDAPADPIPAPADPGAPPPVPGQPVAVAAEAPAPPPGGAPMVPEIPQDQAHYGSGSGPLGFLRDAWHQAKDPYDFGGTPAGEMPTSAPPPGAGPAPSLPPGYTSLNAPGSETIAAPSAPPDHPPLPPGYYSTSAPPPPEYFTAPLPTDPQPPAPGTYVPRHSPPPPPLLPPPE